MIFITLESTALSLSCLTLTLDLYFKSYKNNTTVFFQDLTRTCKKIASFLFLLRKIMHNLMTNLARILLCSGKIMPDSIVKYLHDSFKTLQDHV